MSRYTGIEAARVRRMTIRVIGARTSAFASCGQAVAYALASCVPIPDSCTAANDVRKLDDLFDHLVGAAEQCQRKRQARCPGGLKIDDKLHSYHLLDW
jgi:hypothetical protein